MHAFVHASAPVSGASQRLALMYALTINRTDPHETKVGSATLPVPGFDVKVVNKHGKELEAGEYGNIVLKKPLPPGCLYTLWENHDRFLSSYFSKYMGVAAADGISEYYDTSDAGYKDEDGYVFIMSRTDDVLNVAGHRYVSSRECVHVCVI